MIKLLIIALLFLAGCYGGSYSTAPGNYPSGYGQKFIYEGGKYKGYYYRGEGSDVSSFAPAGGGKRTNCVHSGDLVVCY